MTVDRPVPIILGWADVAAESLRLQEQGVPGEEAWCIAAGVPRARGAGRTGGGIPATRVEQVVAWVSAQAERVTSAQVAEGVGLSESDAANHLRTAERRGLLAMAGTVVVGHARRILWRAP